MVKSSLSFIVRNYHRRYNIYCVLLAGKPRKEDLFVHVSSKDAEKQTQFSSLFTHRGCDPRPMKLSVQYRVVHVISDRQQS